MNNIRVCIDATPLLLRSAGVKTYVFNWALHLMRLAGPHKISLFPFLKGVGDCVHDRSILDRAPTLARIAVLHAANVFGPSVLEWAGPRVDVFHASHQLRHPPRNKKLTATVYDMTCWLAPELHMAKNVKGAKAFAETVLKRADGLVAISECTRADSAKILGIDPEKIAVIYPGVAGPYFEMTPEIGRETARSYGLSRPYALFVGTVEPRKNVSTLLDAYQQLPGSLRGEFDLVVIGPAGWGERSVIARLESGIPGVRYLGYVPEAALPGLTAGAAVFLYPSLYEGFGLPVAQAMAAGTPVITSHLSSLPEVAGGAALLLDPRSPNEIRAALEKLLLSPPLRADLAQKGRERARQYRWELCAEKSWKWFEKVCS